MKCSKRVIQIVAVFIIAAHGQDCRTRGKKCVDHEQCCGGCCVGGECIDTYRSCLVSFDLCRDHSCIGAESCVLFVPPQCAGCEPIPVCRNF